MGKNDQKWDKSGIFKDKFAERFGSVIIIRPPSLVGLLLIQQNNYQLIKSSFSDPRINKKREFRIVLKFSIQDIFF